MAKKTGRRSSLEPSPQDLIRAALWARGRLTRGEGAKEGDCSLEWADEVFRREIAKGRVRKVRYGGRRAPGERVFYEDLNREAWEDLVRLARHLGVEVPWLLQHHREALTAFLGQVHLYRIVLGGDPLEDFGMGPLPWAD